jgi:hypothetical protein
VWNRSSRQILCGGLAGSDRAWKPIYTPYNKGLAGGARTRPESKPYRIIRSFSILQILKNIFAKLILKKYFKPNQIFLGSILQPF